MVGALNLSAAFGKLNYVYVLMFDVTNFSPVILPAAYYPGPGSFALFSRASFSVGRLAAMEYVRPALLLFP